MTTPPSGYRKKYTGRLISASLLLFITWLSFGKGATSQAWGTRIELHDIIPESRVVINIPSGLLANGLRPTRVILYALPNGNTIEQTEGRAVTDESEWRYNIQHIAAQTAFLRERDPSHNYVTVYVESKTRAWTSHASKYALSGTMYTTLIDSIRHFLAYNFSDFASLENQQFILASHSGGGRFVLNYIAANEALPHFIKRIIFIDSNYGYETEIHSVKIADWLKRDHNHLEVMAYVDTTVILDGKPIVSSKGGTGYRSHMMAEDLKNSGVDLNFVADTTFKKYSGNSAEVIIKENPSGKIYHTVLVEKNGLIHGVLSGSGLSEKGYVFWGERAFEKYIAKP
jgi:hypothetical protein